MSDFRDIPHICLPDNYVLGCTYSGANNYNPNATVDDGSCVFSLGNTFDVEIFGLQYQECIATTGEIEAFFVIEIPQIIAYNPVTDFDMFIQFYAYPYQYSNLSLLNVNCNSSNAEYLSNTVSANVINRLQNQRKHIMHIDSLNPNFAMGFQIDENDSNFNTTLEELPIDIKIISDGREYNTSAVISIDQYFGSPTPNIITV